MMLRYDLINLFFSLVKIVNYESIYFISNWYYSFSWY